MVSALVVVICGCDALLGLGDYSVVPADGGGEDVNNPPPDASDDAFVGECTTNEECTERATAEGPLDSGTPDAADASDGSDGSVSVDAGPIAAVCVKPQYKCARLLSPDCYKITGPYLDNNAVVLATLFSTVGSQAGTNTPREQSALLAAEEINKVGGLPPVVPGGPRRPLVVVSCNETTDLLRAGGHLINDLHVPAMVGPNTSQDVLDLSLKMSVKAGTLLMSPASVASSIADLEDDSLTWRNIPSDVQRAPLMIKQINGLESQLRADRGKTTLKLGIIYKNDAFGIASFNSLSPMKFNGDGLSAPVNINNVKVEAYDPTAASLSDTVTRFRDYAPDIVALIGTAEAVTKVLSPLETAWIGDAGLDQRPYYVLTDSSKVNELLNAVTTFGDSLRVRVRGTGVTPQASSVPVLNAFKLTYQSRYGTAATVSSMGQSYDAMYSIVYAIAATNDQPVTGHNIAVGLRSLSGGATTLDVGSQKILAAFQLLTEKQKISVNGTFGSFEWDSRGDTLGTIEVWCVNSGATPAYASSGLTFDTKTQQLTGAYTQCP